jgi:ABC-2 type transport system ATP-binding protein
MSIAALNDVVKRYGDSVALDHVDLEVRPGEILGLLGPNGAGKTTAILVLAGLLASDAGSVHVFDQPQSPGARALKRRLGIVTQDVTIFEDLSAWENLAFFGGLYGLRGKDLSDRIRETLAFVGLVEHAHRRPKKFSGGMKRRLNLACALTHRPEFLVMDEPTVGIDPQSRNHILESVRALRASGTTILYTSHYMEEVEAIATRVAIMDQGRLIAEGTIDELIERIRFEESVTAEVGAVPPGLPRELSAIDGVKEVTQEGGKLRIVSRAGAGNLDRLMACLQAAGGVRSIVSEKPTLEHVFLTLTGKSLRDGGAA